LKQPGRSVRPLRAVYVHGRPAPHPNRLELLPVIGAELVPADFRLPWAHLERPPFLRKLASLVVCAVAFPDRRRWDLLIGDGPQHLPLVMRSLGLLGPSQKTMPYLAGEFPFFLATGHYGPRKTSLLSAWFRRWDAYLCVGPMIAELVKRTLPVERHRDILTFPNFIREARAREMALVEPTLQGVELCFVGHGPGGFRVFYKGLDMLLEAVARVRSTRPDVSCTIVGDWDQATRCALAARAGQGDAIRWLGPLGDLAPVFRSSALLVHCGRGDAWPNTVMEAMAAGVPALVSEWTGGREVVGRIDPRLVAPLDAGAFAERILWYLALGAEARLALGRRARQLVLSELTQASSQRAFREVIREALVRFDAAHLALPGDAA